MKKIILDFGTVKTKQEVHEYIAEQMDFPEYYGKNLDALYDMLTSIAEPTAIGIFMPANDFDELDIDLMMYLEKVKDTFNDAEIDNSDIAVIYGDISENYPEGGHEDEELMKIFKEVGYDLNDINADDSDGYIHDDYTDDDYSANRKNVLRDGWDIQK